MPNGKKSKAVVLPQTYNPAMPLTDITPHPANPNEGDVGLLAEMFDANGFAGAVLVQKSTGILIDGETRWRAAQDKGLQTLPAIVLDVDDDTRDRLLAEWNETGRRGNNNPTKLLALLKGLASTPRGLEGAVFDGDDIDSLMARLNIPLHIDGAQPNAGYSETTDEAGERANRTENYADRKAGGALVEMILVFTAPQREEVGALLDAARSALGAKDARAADVVLQGLRVYVAMAEGNIDTAQSIVAAGLDTTGGTNEAASALLDEDGEDAAEE